VNEQDLLAESFQAHRTHLRSVAYRMLGSLSDADDAVQEAWLRLSRSDTGEIANLGGWLTTVVGRVCLDMLRSRKSRREEPLPFRVPDPIVSADDGSDPEHQAVLADSVGLALLVVLETLTPAERLAFVLHDMFAVPFEQIASIIGRSPAASKQLASRARRRVQGAAPVPDRDLNRQKQIVDAFLTAARGGDFEALVALLDPDVQLRADVGALGPGTSTLVRGAAEVGSRTLAFARFAKFARPALVNGAPGLVAIRDGEPISVLAFSISGGKIVELDILADPERLRQFDLSDLA
jgi:RNA polymerase sigma-70 factor (ECF subfamily)